MNRAYRRCLGPQRGEEGSLRLIYTSPQLKAEQLKGREGCPGGGGVLSALLSLWVARRHVAKTKRWD